MSDIPLLGDVGVGAGGPPDLPDVRSEAGFEQYHQLTGKEVADNPASYVRDESTLGKVVLGKFYDYLLNPLWNAGSSFVQEGFVNPAVGVANLVGADIEPPNVKAGFQALVRKATGVAEGSLSEVYRQEMSRNAAHQESLSAGGRVAGGAGNLAGWVYGTFSPTTVSGQIFKGGNVVAGKLVGTTVASGAASSILRRILGSKAPTLLPKMTSAAQHGLSFGALESIRHGWNPETGQAADGWERLEAGAWAAATYPVFELMGGLTRAAMSKWVAKGETNQAYQAWQQYITKNKLGPLANENPEQFLGRTVNQWIEAGMPGKHGLTYQKLVAGATESVVEGLGISVMDAEFREDAIDALLNQDYPAFLRASEKAAANMLGLAALKAGGSLKDIVPWQRSQPTAPIRRPRTPELTEPGKPEPTDVEFEVRDTNLPALTDKPQPPGKVPPKRRIAEGTEQPEQGEPITLPAETPGPSREPVEVDGNLARLGWAPTADNRVEIPDTPYAYDALGDMAAPNDRLRQALLLPEGPIPRVDLDAKLELVSLVDAMASKRRLPGKEVSVEGVRADKKMLRRVVLGEVWERPIKSGGRWQRAQDPPTKPADLIPEQQQMVVNDLMKLRQMRTDLTPDSEVLLDQIAATLSFVSGGKDEGVGAALEVLTSGAMLPALTGTPDQARMALREIAHMMTTKDPMVAAQDFQTGVAESQPGIHEVPREKFVEGKVGTERARAYKAHKRAVEQAYAQGKVIPLDVAKDYPHVGPSPELPNQGAPVAPSVLRQAELFEEVPAAEEAPSEPQEARSGELGAFDPSVVTEAAVAVGRAGKAVFDVAVSVVDAYSQPLIERVRSKGLREEADKALAAVTDAKGFRGQINNPVRDLLKKVNKDTEVRRELEPRVWRGNYGFTTFHLAMDVAAGKAMEFDPTTLSRGSQEWVAGAEGIYLATGRMMESVGAKTRTKEGDFIPFKAGEGDRRLTRHPTPQGADAFMRQSKAAKVWLEAVAELNGLSLKEAEAKWSEARSLIARDPTEIARIFEVVPDAVIVDGRVVEMYEARPYEWMVAHSTFTPMRAAYIKHFGGDVPTPKEAQDALATVADGMPVPSPKLVLKAMKHGGPLAAKDMAAMIRALNGLPVHAPYDFLEPGSGPAEMARALQGLMALWRGSKLIRSFIPNIPEPFGAPAGFLGYGNITRSFGEVWKSIASLKVQDLIDQLAARGMVTSDVRNWRSQGETKGETVQRMGRVGGQALNTLGHFAQEVGELVVATAALRAAEAMRRGEGTTGHRRLLELMGVDPARAEAIARGEGNPAEYELFERNAVSTLMGGTTAMPAEQSLASHNRAFQNLTAFQNYPQTRMRQFREAMRQAATLGAEGKAAAGVELLRFLVPAAISGTMAVNLLALFKDGIEGVAQWFHEAMENPEEALYQAVVQSSIGGPLAEVSDVALDPGKSMWDAIGRMAAPLSAAREMVDMVEGIASAFVGHELPSGHPYAGLKPLEAVEMAFRQTLPVWKDASKGLFGVSAIAWAEDPEIGGMQDAFWRWMRQNGKVGARQVGEPEDSEEALSFRNAMRNVSKLVKEGKRQGDPEIREQMMKAVKAKGWESVARSLSARRMQANPKFHDLEPAERKELREFMGEEKWKVLLRHDRVLEQMARWARWE